MLHFVKDDRPKVRKCGQEAVRLVLNSCASSIDSDAKSNYVFISNLVADYCLQFIAQEAKSEPEYDQDQESTAVGVDRNNNTNTKSEKTKNVSSKTKNQRVLHVLILFKYVIHHFGVHKIKAVGECLLRLMTLKDIVSMILLAAQFCVFSSENLC